MKKFIVLILFALFAVVTVNTVYADQSTESIYVHYYRYAGDYDDWLLWAWQSEPESLGGSDYQFEDDDTDSQYNFGGVVAKIDIDENLSEIEEMGFIVHRSDSQNDWAEKDIDSDRFVTIPETTPTGTFHIYLVQADPAIGTSLDDPDGPDKSPKFFSAYFTDMRTITYKATEEFDQGDIRVLSDGNELNVDNITIDGWNGTVVLTEDIDFSQTYTIEGTFGDSSVKEYSVTFDGIYDTEEFEDAFAYEGDDLGAIPLEDKTTFRLWAPISDKIELNLYDTGTPAKHGGTDDPVKTVEMTSDVKGTFYHEEPGNLHGVYYTYSVTNGSKTNEVVDPYAKSTGINGLRGLVVDFEQMNPDGFEYGDRPDNMDAATDAIIYELHVRDLTTHESWNGSEENRGKYLGLIEEGTTYDGASTGFDHMKDLGITHVQLLPFFDYGVVDETRVDDPDYNAFNWGYMPLNFNTLEGTYSADPYDGLVRVSEMKQVVASMTDSDIRINMDVVYNHTGLTANSNFNLIVPGYYHRKTASGAFSNGSGTGNETASERAMMRKFIVDSTTFWATEYNISGFRFDLMALHDIETMNAVADALHAIDSSIMVYGEPWMGGTSPLPASMQAGKKNLDQIEGVGAFNDDFRDAVKGSVFASAQGGYVQGDFSESVITRVKYGIAGGTDHEAIKASLLTPYEIWHTQPTKTINYVTAHDNNTLHDKLHLTLEDDGRLDLLPDMFKQSYALLMTSQGIAFIHAGDEFMRSKPAEDGEGFDENSYESPDSVNQIRWNLKTSEEGNEIHEYICGLIELRNEHPSFRMDQASEVKENLTFLYEEEEGIIAYTITNDDSGDVHDTILVVHNANDGNEKVKLPEGGGWVLIVDGDEANEDAIESFKGNKRISIPAHTSYVMYQDASIPDYNPLPSIILSVVGGLVVIGGVAAYLIFIKKKTA